MLVGINQIKNYSKKKPNKIFDVIIKGVYQRCLIGAVHDSKEELTNLIENGERIRFPSAAILSELSESDDQASSKKNTSSTLTDNTRDILNSKLLALDKKRFSHEKNDDLSTMGIGENSKSEIHVERENAAKRKRSKDTNGLDNKENDLKSSKKLKKEPGLSKVIMIVPKDDNSTKNSRNLEKTKIVEEDTEIPPGPSSNELPQLLNKPRTSTFSDNKTKDEMETYPDNVSEANTVETTGKDKKKKKHHHSKDEKLMTQIDEMQHELHEMRSEQKVQRQMLQQVLDFCNEYKETPSNQESHELEKKTGVPKVGFTRVADNSVHLGQGIYVPKNSYLTASSRSKSTSQFVRKMIMAVFTAEELQASSVHGAKSNKIKQNEQKPGLDPTRLQAVKDIFSYYLQEIKMPVHKYDQEMKAFYSYVSSKITDTRAESKRLPKSNNPIPDSDLEEDTIASSSEDDSEESEVADDNSNNGICNKNSNESNKKNAKFSEKLGEKKESEEEKDEGNKSEEATAEMNYDNIDPEMNSDNNDPDKEIISCSEKKD